MGVVVADSGMEVRIIEAQRAIELMQDSILASQNTLYEICNLKRSRQTMPIHYDGDKRLAIIKRGNIKAVAKQSEGYMLSGKTPTRPAKEGREISAEVTTVANTCHFNYRINGDIKMIIANAAMAKSMTALSEALHEDSQQ